MNAYRFFGLVDANDASTDDLATLALHPDKRATKLKELIKDQYMLVLDKGDISKATMKMLETAFEAIYPVTGDTKQKAITFFLKAAKFSDLPLSPYLLTQLRSAAKKPRRSRQRTAQDDSEVDLTSAPNLSSHAVQLASGGRLTITISANPFIMPAEDRNFFFSVVDMLQKYKEQHPQAQQSENDDDEDE
jgi:hypothetical protein